MAATTDEQRKKLIEDAGDSASTVTSTESTTAASTVVARNPAQNIELLTMQEAMKQSLGLSSLIGLTLLIGTAGNFGTTIMLARIDDEGKNLAASNLINSCQNMVMTSSSAMIFSVSTSVSTELGRGNVNNIAAIFRNAALFSLPLAGTSCILLLNSGPILSKLGEPQDLADITQAYFEGYSWGIPAILLLGVEQQIALGGFNLLPVNVISFINVGLTLSLGHILINGDLGSHRLNAAGLGHATSISAWLSLGGFTLYLKYSDRFAALNLLKLPDILGHYFNKEILTDLISLGIPIGIQVGSEFTGLTISTAIIGSALKRDDLAANEIAMQYLFLTIVPIFGIGQASNILIGQARGQNNHHNVRTFSKACLVLGLGASMLALTIFTSMPKQLMSPFIHVDDAENADVVNTTRYLLALNGANQVFDALRVVGAGALQGGFRDTPYSMGAGILGMCVVAVPVGYALGLPAGLGVAGLYIGRGIGMSIGATAVLGRLYSKLKGMVAGEGYQALSSGAALNAETLGTPAAPVTSAVASTTTTRNHSPDSTPKVVASAGKASREKDKDEALYFSYKPSPSSTAANTAIAPATAAAASSKTSPGKKPVTATTPSQPQSERQSNKSRCIIM